MGRSKKMRLVVCILLMFACLKTKDVFATVPVLTDKGVVGASYTVFFPHKEAYLSRDGSLAMQVTSPIKVEQPGTYFLWVIDTKGRGRNIKFTVTPKKDRNKFIVNKQQDLEEIFKYVLSEFKEEVTLQFDYGTFNIHELNTLCLYYAEKALVTYPILTFDSFALSSKGGEKPTVRLNIKYPLENKEDLVSLKQKTEKQITKILGENLQFSMGEIAREKALYTYVINNVEYSDKSNALDYTLSGALVKGRSVCDGYAKSIQYLFNITGMPTYYVRGSAKEDVHAWNIVELNQGYYHVDATWGEGIDAAQYFNQTDSYMQQTHSWQQTLYPKCEAPALPY